MPLLSWRGVNPIVSRRGDDKHRRNDSSIGSSNHIAIFIIASGKLIEIVRISINRKHLRETLGHLKPSKRRGRSSSRRIDRNRKVMSSGSVKGSISSDIIKQINGITLKLIAFIDLITLYQHFGLLPCKLGISSRKARFISDHTNITRPLNVQVTLVVTIKLIKIEDIVRPIGDTPWPKKRSEVNALDPPGFKLVLLKA
jgi:hypothetical protein